MREPKTVEEATTIVRAMFQKQAGLVILTMIDQLVDLAIRGGMPIEDNLHDFKKLNFYKRVIAVLVRSGVRS